MVGYLLKNTVSERGTVSRGVCRVEDGRLLGIKETLKIRLEPDGTIADEAEGVLPADAVVSMNFWGFAPSFFQELEMFSTISSAMRPGIISKPSACCPAWWVNSSVRGS